MGDLPSNEQVVFVAGSAHMDVLAQVIGDDAAIDKIGQVSIEIGGTACNIATNLAALGISPRLLTAMPSDSPYSGIINAHLCEHGVDFRVIHRNGMSSAVFSAHIGIDGEMLSAVSSMPVESVVFTEKEIQDAMFGAVAAVLDCNLSGEALAMMARMAACMNIPVYVAAVSEEKSLRLARIDVPIAGVFINRREAAYFGQKILGSTSLTGIANRLQSVIVATQGADGVMVVDAESETHIAAAKCVDGIHTLGAGDALMAASVKGCIEGKSILEAVSNAVNFAARVLQQPNCNVGQNKAMETALIAMERMANRDAMTGLANRRSGEHALQAAISYAANNNSTFTVLLLDIDHFKRVNDTYGHAIGDEAIKAVSRLIEMALRQNDLACRWGGEEFLCVLLGVEMKDAAVIAERIRQSVEVAIIPVAGNVSVSIGVATFDIGETAEEVVNHADEALYAAKHGGRNQVCFAA